jgi:hypothetical protein
VLCQNSLIAADLPLRAPYVALWYSLITPPTTLLRSIRAVISTTRPAWLAQRGFLSQALVRTVAVIVRRVLGEHLPQVLLIDDQHMFQAFAAKRAREPLRE